MDIIDRVMRRIPELDHCTYFTLDYKGEELCIAVDFGLRGAWVVRKGRLQCVNVSADPELTALLERNDIRV